MNYRVVKDSYEEFTGYAYVNISKAANAWVTEPSITGWTYGETPVTPDTGSAKFGTVKVEYKPVGAQDSEYTTKVPTQAGDYKVRFSVAGGTNYTGLSVEKELTVAKVKITVKADDKSKTYGEDDPQLTWKLTKGTLVSGDELSVNVTRTPGEDVYTYTITASQTAGANPNYDITFESGTFTIGIADRTAPDGLTGIDEDVEGRANGKITGVDGTMQYRKEGSTDYLDITGTELTDLASGTYYIRYKADKNHNASADTQIVLNKGGKLKVTVPENQIGYTLTVNKAQLVWNDSVEITFVLKDGYSKLDNFAVKVNGTPIELDENGKYTVIYPEKDVEITVDGVADIDAPVISGIADGETHYGDTSFTVTDDNLDSVKADGNEVTPTDGKYIIKADGQEHTIVATDKSGNSSGEIKITVITIASIDDSIEHLTPENVKSSDKEAIEDVQSLVNELINSGKDFTDTEDQELADMKENIEKLLQKIGEISDKNSDITDKVNAYDKDNVTSDDKQDIKDLIADIDELLEGDNLSDPEREELDKLKDAANALIDIIEESSPSTGDKGTAWLRFMLLFVCGSGLWGATAYRRKKKYLAK